MDWVICKYSNIPTEIVLSLISVLWANRVTAYVECLCGLLRGRKVNKNNTINKKEGIGKRRGYNLSIRYLSTSLNEQIITRNWQKLSPYFDLPTAESPRHMILISDCED